MRWLAVLGLLLSIACGSPHENQGWQVSQAIVGGEIDTEQTAVVAIVDTEAIVEPPNCSATLVLPNLVLTARHCLVSVESPSGDLSCGIARFGPEIDSSSVQVAIDQDVTDGVPPEHLFAISEVMQPATAEVCGGDLCFALLTESVAADIAEPVDVRLNSSPFVSDAFTSYGFGSSVSEAGEDAGQRRRSDAGTVRCFGTECVALGLAASAIAEGEWLGEGPACVGDSGGPAIDQDGRLVGVMSRGSACEVSIYQSPAWHADFIREAGRRAALIGGFAEPSWASTDDQGDVAATSSRSTGGGCSVAVNGFGHNRITNDFTFVALLLFAAGRLVNRLSERY